MPETNTERRDRVRRWALAYRQLQQGGLGSVVHGAGVDKFADDSGTHPYLDVADVEWLLWQSTP